MTQTPDLKSPPAAPPARRHEAIDVLALVFAIVVPVVGLVLSLVARSSAKRNGRRPDGLTTAALIVSIVLTALGVITAVLVIIFTVLAVGQTTAALKDLDTSPGTHQSATARQGSVSTVDIAVQSNDQPAGFNAAAKTVLESRLASGGIDDVTVTGSAADGFQIRFSDTVTASQLNKVVAAVQPDATLDGFVPVQYVTSDPFSITSGTEVTADTACAKAGPTTVSADQSVVCAATSPQTMYLMGSTPALPLTDVAAASVDDSESLTITLNSSGTAALRTVTTDLVQQSAPADQLAIVAGGRVLEAPTVNSVITNGILQISGGDASDIAAELTFASQAGAFTVQ